MRKVLIAGASGFIGHALIDTLLKYEDIEIVGLSRSDRKSHHPRLTWKRCDLFSLKDITLAMEGCETGYYLVHSMLPGASLSQGTFYDFDLIMADNFVRAARQQHLKQIIYLGGMIPEGEELSWHLRSRLEVEETLRTSGVPTTSLRAGLIIGPGGSSFTILKRLIERLPVMLLPAWTNTRSQPVALTDVIKVLDRCLNEASVKGGIFDIGGPEIVTYKELIEKTANKIERTSKLIAFNIIPLALSRFWVTLVTGVPKNLVYPLVLSLRHEMLAQEENRWPWPDDLSTPLDPALGAAMQVQGTPPFKGHVPQGRDVRSVQRLVLPPGANAEWVAQAYFDWLPIWFSTLIKVTIKGECCIFYFIHPWVQILILQKSRDRSSPDRQLLYVVGGMLSAQEGRGRLEFREVLNRQYVMAALHEFRPSLPWYIYRWTQAVAHLIVMKAFGDFLKWHIISGKKVKL
jgi:uncharacterized protein YbjT (DUF2867 family)